MRMCSSWINKATALRTEPGYPESKLPEKGDLHTTTMPPCKLSQSTRTQTQLSMAPKNTDT